MGFWTLAHWSLIVFYSLLLLNLFNVIFYWWMPFPIGSHECVIYLYKWYINNLSSISQDQKKIQDLLLTERESIYGSKPSPRKSNSFRKPNGYRANGNGSMTPTPRRNSVGGGTPELLTPRSYSGRQNGYFKEMRRLSTAPLNFVAISKEDTISTYTSVCGSELGSPPHS